MRELQRELKVQGVQLISEADESTTGPVSFMALHPDRNPILVDQHVQIDSTADLAQLMELPRSEQPVFDGSLRLLRRPGVRA